MQIDFGRNYYDSDTASETAAAAPMEGYHPGDARHPLDGRAHHRTLVRAGRIGGDFRMIRYFTPMGWTAIVGAAAFLVLLICG